MIVAHNGLRLDCNDAVDGSRCHAEWEAVLSGHGVNSTYAEPAVLVRSLGISPPGTGTKKYETRCIGIVAIGIVRVTMNHLVKG